MYRKLRKRGKNSLYVSIPLNYSRRSLANSRWCSMSYLLAWPLNSSLINPGISWNFWNSLPLVVLEPCHEERNPEAAFRLSCHLQAKQWSFEWNITVFFLKKNITSPVLGSTQLHPAAVFTWKGAHRITAPHLSSFCSHRSPRWPLDAGHQKCCQWPCPAGAWLSWFRWRSPVAKTLAKKYWQTVD